jgi:hypothetical protein
VHDLRSKSGIWIVDISDHLPVFTIIPNGSPNKQIKKNVSIRISNIGSHNKFKLELSNFDWSILNNSIDINSMYSKFINVVQYQYDKAFPLINKTVTISDKCRPWITRGIRKSICKKHSLYKQYLKTRSEQSCLVYKTYRNKLTAILRKSEKMYYLQKLDSVKGNLTKTWKILNTITLRNNQKETIDEIICNNSIIKDPKQITDRFNHFFANVGADLAKNISPVPGTFTQFLPASNPKSVFFKPTDESEIEQILHSLKNSDSKGHDNLSVKTIKSYSTELSKPLAFIFNQSMMYGIVPDDLKIAKIIPIYKCDDKKIISNYRPISVLPVFSKILERLIYNRLLNFIDQQCILSRSQYGFRKNISTAMALVDLIDKISSSIEKNEYTIGIFIDLAKAFDTVNHDILLKKLYHYGVRGIPYEWFKSYLNNRKQYVYLNNIQSNKLPITCGVPQGSILGPLLFLLYINDLSTVTNLLTFIMFADDTNIFISGKNLDHIASVVNIELKTINTWFSVNLLSLNIKKTNYMLFGNKKLCDASISINKENITRVFQTKFLGVIIQSNLRWNAHISSIANKISKTIGVINKAKHALDTCHLKMLYQCLIEPYLNYCCIVWASPVKNTALESLFKLQKRSVRIICFAGFKAHTLPLFKQLSVSSIYHLCLIQTLIYVYKSINLLLPNHIINYFTRTSCIHSHSTRTQKHTLYINTAIKSCRVYSLACSGPKHWNKLPDSIQSAPSLGIFKSNLKRYIFSTI